MLSLTSLAATRDKRLFRRDRFIANQQARQRLSEQHFLMEELNEDHLELNIIEQDKQE